ncbi:MAG TPA: LysR family transcriptional regulator [Bryobacteraceae bacterium]|nr:LysR family transcriptional regulator [Bryobacteraceae bacterium]HOL71460.1 LysR family transcriptional regulator [Bryobacteraceae bacterium]HOQ45713.1 LysR family transcriptional regulator [Bryobacteraceae bacterium]HPQ14145.1 LysR family transcriptional regulator [Bryobacteraceae bacterium]HPU71560.1 LysR family transcriptional regulator [Bryobacteraceae bacterium]
MNFEHQRLFRDIVQSRSISRGAAMNGISQSAASQHIRELENRLGAPLLDRSSRPFTLTPAGRLYADLCRDVLRRYEEFEIALEALKTEVEGVVRVASIYSIGLSEMTFLKEEFARRYPSAHLNVEYLRPEKVYEAVLDDRADLGLLSYATPSRELVAIPWRQERMVLAASPSHPLARKSSVQPEELAGVDFVAFDEDLPICREINRFLKSRGIEVNRTMHFDNIQMIIQAVVLGAGVSILPQRSLTAEIKLGRLVGIPIEAELVRPLGIIHRKRKKFNKAAALFLELLQEQPAAEMQPA